MVMALLVVEVWRRVGSERSELAEAEANQAGAVEMRIRREQPRTTRLR
jgi:hypothetical protein